MMEIFVIGVVVVFLIGLGIVFKDIVTHGGHRA